MKHDPPHILPRPIKPRRRIRPYVDRVVLLMLGTVLLALSIRAHTRHSMTVGRGAPRIITGWEKHFAATAGMCVACAVILMAIPPSDHPRREKLVGLLLLMFVITLLVSMIIGIVR